MAVRKVIKMGHPLLLARAKEVENYSTAELDNLIADMKDTMADLNGAGLAAPQIAESLRIVIFGVEANPRYPDVESVPETVLINPEITILNSEKESGWEGCLSVPHMRGLVPRYTSIKYHGYDQNGELIEREASGFHARVVQHEVDHLDGILYPQRIENMQNFGFEDELFQVPDEEEM
ncbi:MAG: peptide deformylase [Gammaproteobacteria bacterium]|nr:peptide deformylase [Gammaproteobacteria bacterium]MCW9031186.1 peptide deformylase [Gammaproteobacteria bacterium]